MKTTNQLICMTIQLGNLKKEIAQIQSQIADPDMFCWEDTFSTLEYLSVRASDLAAEIYAAAESRAAKCPLCGCHNGHTRSCGT